MTTNSPRPLSYGGSLTDLDDKVVLVTGGTGSFGRAVTHTLLTEAKPRKVIVFSRDEQKHFRLQQENHDNRLRFFVGDVRDRRRLMRAFEGVDVVLHAAAMKHVSLAEYNPLEAIRTNVDGVVNVIDAALERGVAKVVALSTDKAVNPVNLYGATKLCMEKLIIAANSYRGDSGTVFSVVRYGNVVGSKGSVVELFANQRQSGELTLTDPGMTRFWITMKQAVDLALMAVDASKGGEVFVPKIPAADLKTLAEAMGPDCRFRVVGARPGEKVHEVMCPADDSHITLEFDRHFVIKPTIQFVGHVDFTVNRLGETGQVVEQGFEYNSGTNPHFLDIAEITAMNHLAGA